jgi:hypothetical protein
MCIGPLLTVLSLALAVAVAVRLCVAYACLGAAAQGPDA